MLHPGRPRKEEGLCTRSDTYKADPEKKKAYVRDTYKADPEKKKASVRDTYNANAASKRAAKRQRYQEGVEENRAAKRQRYQEGVEENRAAKRQRYREGLEENRAAKRRIYRGNSATIKAARRSRYWKGRRTTTTTQSYSLFEPNSRTLAEYGVKLEKAILRDSELLSEHGAIPVDLTGRCVVAEEIKDRDKVTMRPLKWKCTNECRKLTIEEVAIVLKTNSLFQKSIEDLRAGLDALDSGCGHVHYDVTLKSHSGFIEQLGHPIYCELPECSSPLRIIRAAMPHFPALRTFTRLLYKARKCHMTILAIDSALASGNIEELIPFMGMRDNLSDLFSEDGVEHAVVSEDHSSSGLGCIERDLKVTHADLIAELHHPEKKKASVRDSYKADPEKKKASVRDSYKADPEKKKASVRDSYNADIESKQSAKRQRYQEDVEENRAAKRQKYEDNSDAIKASERNRYWNDPAVRLAKRAAERKRFRMGHRTTTTTQSYSLYEPKSHALMEYNGGLEKAILRDTQKVVTRSACAAVSKIGADALVSKALSMQCCPPYRPPPAVAAALPPSPPPAAAELPPPPAAESCPHRQQQQSYPRGSGIAGVTELPLPPKGGSDVSKSKAVFCWNLASEEMYNAVLIPFFSLLGVIVPGLTFFVLKVLHTRRKYRHLPSPKTSSFILGHLSDIMKEMKKGRGDNPLDGLILKWHSEVGGVFVMYNLWNASIMVLNPADVKAVFSNPGYHKSMKQTQLFSYMFGERLFGDSLFCIYDIEQHKKERQLYDEAFNNHFLQSIFPKFCERADAFMERLKPLADGKTQVAMKKEIYRYSMDFVSQVIFSFDFDSEWKGRSLGMKYQKPSDYATLWSTIFQGMAISIMNPFFQYMHPNEVKGYREAVRTVRMIGREWIQKRIDAMEREEKVPNDVLTRTIELAKSRGGTVDIESLVDNFVNFHCGGSEPTACILSFAVAVIHLHPDVLQQLQSEIDEVLGKKRTITYEDLSNLKYTEQVILETMRMFSIVSPLPKESPPEGVTLSGHFIPPGTPIGTSIGAICHMPQYFEDPDVFKPSRFSTEMPRPNPGAYFPLGLGTRSCIGKESQFVMMTAKLLIARLLQMFQLTLPDGYNLEIEWKLIKLPYQDIPCTIVCRN
eukprot:Em0005g1014a